MASSHHKDPAHLCFESVVTRRLIIASYWAVVLLAIPLWWKTTSIERLSLPASRVHAQRNRELFFLVDVNLEAQEGVAAQSLQQDLQRWVEFGRHVLDASAVDLKVRAGDASKAAYNVVLGRGNAESTVEGRELRYDMYPEDDAASYDVSLGRLADTLTKLLAPYSSYSASRIQAQRVMKYSPRYRLAFTLLNEDAASGSAAMAWDVQDAIQRQMGPLLAKLSDLHNFTIESQVQFHAPLAFQPRPIQHESRDAHGLTQEDLTVFINSAEWTLSSSVSNDPVIHFVLFIPSSKNNPLHILDHEGFVNPSNAFLLPQWGGIVLLNPSHSPISRLTSSDLVPAFNTFSYQLLTLLGVPGLPLGVDPDPKAGWQPFTDWELDALLRRRALENVQSSRETLEAIVRLVNQIKNMPVGEDVVGDVQAALDALNEVHESAGSSPVTTLQHSARALTLASRAFFNPGMLALLYFPAEHTYAVYTPLFASVAAPLVGAVVRELVAWKRARKEAKAHAERKPDEQRQAQEELAKAD
ncbi:hypothetical protein BV20DRAFT_943936 [Pilatotrama ljubarskyi]|nr:hypothetical protein BV20DRAFT_943936 [Pilatotrama ljubarskyi]